MKNKYRVVVNFKIPQGALNGQLEDGEDICECPSLRNAEMICGSLQIHRISENINYRIVRIDEVE